MLLSLNIQIPAVACVENHSQYILNYLTKKQFVFVHYYYDRVPYDIFLYFESSRILPYDEKTILNL